MVVFCFAFPVYDVSFYDRDIFNIFQVELGQDSLLEMELVLVKVEQLQG